MGFALRLSMLLLLTGCEAPAGTLPGMELLRRAESHLLRHQSELRPLLGHYGLVFPVEDRQLHAFMTQIRVHRSNSELALGTDVGLELHGGGLLQLLFEHWRPGGRPAAMQDRYPFASGPVSLGDLYRAHARGLLAASPGGLPRMRLRQAGPNDRISDSEVDAYHFLSLLAEHEEDPDREWSNHRGERLSLAGLLASVRRHYLETVDTPSEPTDHSKLHLVELLVAFDRRHAGSGVDEVRDRFLSVELARKDFDPGDASLLRAHYVQSLGALAGHPGISWSAAERARVRDWLAALERDHFRNLDAEELNRLSHLVYGLRLLREHADRFE